MHIYSACTVSGKNSQELHDISEGDGQQPMVLVVEIHLQRHSVQCACKTVQDMYIVIIKQYRYIVIMI